MNATVRQLGAHPGECFFWRTQAGAELDLLIVRGRTRAGFEFKRTASPTVTPSMRIAQEDLKLTALTVVHAGRESFPLTRSIRAVALERLLDEVAPLGTWGGGSSARFRRLSFTLPAQQPAAAKPPTDHSPPPADTTRWLRIAARRPPITTDHRPLSTDHRPLTTDHCTLTSPVTPSRYPREVEVQ